MRPLELNARCACALLLLIISASAIAVQPARFVYQGKLSNSAGSPLSGNHTLYFALYQGGTAGVANSGANVYSETVSLPIASGRVEHTVGTGTPTSGTLTQDLFAYSGEIFLQVAIDSPSNVSLPRKRLESVPFAIAAKQPASLFGNFGGTGEDGSKTVVGAETLANSRYEFNDLVIPAGTTLTATQRYTFIAVKGTCTIHGTLSAMGIGARGGAGGNTNSNAGKPGYNATDLQLSTATITMCISGAGGGGTALSMYYSYGGPSSVGGGAGGDGGEKLQNGHPTFPLHFAQTGMATAGSGLSTTDSFIHLLQYGGAGGGGGGVYEAGSGEPIFGGNGGNGGGVIYLECSQLQLTGTLTAAGQDGGNGLTTSFAYAQGGGGGGGGVALVRTRKVLANSGIVTAAGGAPGIPQIGETATPISSCRGAHGFWDVVELP